MAYPNLDDHARMLAQHLLSDHSTFCRQLMRLLAERAQPVSLEAVATTLHVSVEEIAATVRQIPDLEFDEAGHLVGMGLSLVPTPHQFFLQERRMFTWCAFDTLTYPVVLQQEAHVESRCQVTGTPIRLLVTPVRIASLDHGEAVISLPIPEAATCCDRSSFCDHGHFFSSPQVAATFLSTHPGALVLPVVDAYQFGQKYLTYKQAYLEAREKQTENTGMIGTSE
jgi:alkylmercury lyase